MKIDETMCGALCMGEGLPCVRQKGHRDEPHRDYEGCTWGMTREERGERPHPAVAAMQADDALEEVDTIDVSEEEYDALKEAVREHHERHGGPQILRAFCRCGHPTGPGTLACEALRKLSGG